MNSDDATLSGRRRGCNCKKSGCLKLYCECFAAGGRCSERCQCVSCKNHENNQGEITQAIQAIEKRTQKSFRPVSRASEPQTRADPANQAARGAMSNNETPATFPTEREAAVAMAGTSPKPCRNTETFVSAKKMLVFAGVSADDNDLRVTIRPSQRKLVKRPKKSETQSGMLTPTNASTQRPSALELLSRSAPAAPSKLHHHEDSAMGIAPTTPTKRPSSYLDLVPGVVTPTFAKRKYTRRSFSQLQFMERIQELAAPTVELPNVEDTVTNAYDARNTEGVGDPELTILSRSLLHTAMAVEFAEEKETAPPVDQQSRTSKPQRVPGSSDARKALSPTAAGLFCEEEYSEAAADDYTSTTNGNGASYNSHTNDHEGKYKETNLSVMQERAVLQEFSVWLRNLAASLSQ
ncbi:hypothetical protein PInf_014334 [Phytophthora infestans]|nr:hypothetical protein PInf_014334 [Phytophthora infestans]